MPGRFTVSSKYFPAAVEMTISLMLAVVALMCLSAASPAQGPALTTINEVRYTDAGWGAGYNGNLAGRFTSSSFALLRYARAQGYFLRSYDGSEPPRYSRNSAKLYVDYPL